MRRTWNGANGHGGLLQRQVLPNAEHLPHADLEYRQGDEHFHLVTERRYLKSDTLIVIGASVNNMRHIDDDVKSGQFDLMLEPSAGFLLARANRDERRAMRGPVVRAYDVEVMRDLLA